MIIVPYKLFKSQYAQARFEVDFNEIVLTLPVSSVDDHWSRDLIKRFILGNSTIDNMFLLKL